MTLIDMPFDVLCIDGFKPIEMVNACVDQIATCDKNSMLIQYDYITSILICPTRFQKASYSNLASMYSQITTTFNQTVNHETFVTTATNGHHKEKQMAMELLQSLKPKTDNYYDTLESSAFTITVNNFGEASKLQQVGTHAGYVVEIRENSMTDYSVNVLGNEQILGMAIKQYSVGNGNYAASLTVPDMERKKLVVRVKTNNIYKVYIL
tara:strand:+ start:2505 stop:3131 length:627 start_codon:yes stop_codon:yes gene_type:complete